MAAPATASQPVSLRKRCLQLVAAAIVEQRLQGGSSSAGSAAWRLQQGIVMLPQELQQEILLLLASWQLLDDDACTLLAGAGGTAGSSGGSGSSSSGTTSILSGAAAVSLAHCVLLSGGALQRLFGCPLPQLQVLSLRSLPQLTDAHVALVAQQCPSLTRLDLSKCPELTAAAVQALAAAACAPQLQALALAGCWRVARLPGLALRCTALASLDLSGCWQLTDCELRQTLAALPLLEDLNLSGCHNLRSAAFVAATRQPSRAAMVAAELRQAEQQLQVPQPLGQLERGGEGGGRAAGRRLVQQWQGEGQAAAGQQPGAEQPGAAEHGAGPQQEGPENVAEEGAGSLDALGEFPVDGVVLPKLRSLDLSGTQVDDCLLYWLAQRSCGRLQKLALSNTAATGCGLGALLLAKRALLHHVQTSNGGQASSGSAQATQAAAAGVLPLLELGIGGTPACGAAERGGHVVPRHWAEAAMEEWEAAQGGFPLHLPPSRGSSSSPADALGSGTASDPRSSSSRPLQPALTISLLEPPAHSPAAGRLWPPHGPAEALECLGPAGLSQLQVLDAGGATGVAALAELLAAHCSSLQRLRVPGCTSLSDASLAAVLAAAPQLRELDVSGCSGIKVSRPGSRFLRHKAARLQEGGLSDESLRLLGRPQQAQQQQQQQPGGAQFAAGLQSLKAGGLSLTDATLASLPPSLTAISLRACKRVSDSGLLQLLLHCPSLARLDATGCSQLTAGGFGSHTPLAAHQSSGGGCSITSHSSNSSSSSQQVAVEEETMLQLGAFRRVVSTASAVQLQRASLSKQACTLEVLAWLAGQASSSSGSNNGSSSGGSSSTAGLPGRPALQRLELASCALLAEADLLALAASCPQLRSLQLSAAGPAAGPRLCAALAQHCRLLSSVSLCGGTGVGDADVALLLRQLPGLQQLDLSGCGGVTGAAFMERFRLAVVGQQAAGGSAAVGGGTAGVAAAAEVAVVAKRTPATAPAGTAAAAAQTSSAAVERWPGRTALRVLKLDGCLITEAAAVAIAGTCPHLETLSLRQCTAVTSAAATALLWCCRNLRQLLLGGSRAVDMFGAASGLPPGFHAAAAAAGLPCERCTLVDVVHSEQRAPAQLGPLSLVELPRDSWTVRRAGDWPAAPFLGKPRVQLA